MKICLAALAVLALAAPSYVRRPPCKRAVQHAEKSESPSTSEVRGSGSAETSNAVPGAKLGRISQALDVTATDSKMILARILELKPSLSDGLSFDIAHETARWSRVYGIRWQLAVALMWHESRLDPWAVSPTNDYGLGQLHGKKYFRADGQPDVPSQVRYCLLHLKGCLDAAHGNERIALGHYNAGSKCNLTYADKVLKEAK